MALIKNVDGVDVEMTPEEEAEPVITIDRQPAKTVVLTPKRAYPIPATARCPWLIGEILVPGRFVSPDVDMWTFGSGSLPSWLQAVIATDGMISQKYANRVIFENREVPLTERSTPPHVLFSLGDQQASFEILREASLSSELVEAIETLRQAQKKGLKIFGETCPQYIALTADDIQALRALGLRRVIDFRGAQERQTAARQPQRQNLNVAVCDRQFERRPADTGCWRLGG